MFIKDDGKNCKKKIYLKTRSKLEPKLNSSHERLNFDLSCSTSKKIQRKLSKSNRLRLEINFVMMQNHNIQNVPLKIPQIPAKSMITLRTKRKRQKALPKYII